MGASGRIAFLMLLTAGAAAPASTEVFNRRIQPNQVLAQALREAGVNAADTAAVIDALKDAFDFRRCRSGDQLRVVVEGGLLTEVDYRQGATDEWLVTRAGQKLVAQRRDVQVEKRLARVELTVESSLYEAVLAAREDPAIALALADVFAWDVDFYQDVRRGDRVTAVVEKYLSAGRLVRYGEVLAAQYEGSAVGQKRVFRYQLPGGDVSYFQESGASARKSFLKSPLKYAHVTSRFGSRFHPILQYVKAHNGVDYGTPVGTPVWAVADGTVTRAGLEGGAGRMLCLRHLNDFETCYLHLSGFGHGVHVGAHVAQKQVIAYSGNSGLSTGPHLHFALKHGGRFVNPLTQRFPRADPLPATLVADFRAKVAPLVSQLDTHPSPAWGDRLAPATLVIPHP